MNLKEKGWRQATVEVTICEPALTASTFDLVRTYAQAYGLPDVGRIGVMLTVDFAGVATEDQISELSKKLDDLWLGQVVKLESREWAKRRGEQ